MRGSLIAAGLAVVGLLLSGCGDDGPPEPEGAALSKLSGDDMCGLLPKSDVEQAFQDKVTKVKGDSMAKAPFTIVSCHYGVEFELMEVETLPPSVDTKVSMGYRKKDTQQSLDQAFRDLDDKVVDYQPVDGVGTAAGFGPNAMLEDLGGHVLVVLFDAGGESYKLEVGASPKGTLDQLKPLAEKVLAGLQKQLS